MDLNLNNKIEIALSNGKLLNYFILVYFILAFFTIYFFQGTGDTGDSVHHYLFAKYAPVHPELFFNHWAKPLFVLLASPFAQFGFVGVKVFNVLITGASMYFTVRSAQNLQLKNSLLVFLIVLFSPLCYTLTFSGLTEPLFAFFIGLSFFLITKNKFITASVLISFLPFIRSEGLIIIGVLALFFLYKKQWKSLLLLSFGHIFYSIAGWPVTNDLLWVFNKIPYAQLSSTYGSGGIFHFVRQLFYVIGAPIYILFVVGVIKLIVSAFHKKIHSELFIIVFLGTGVFILAHSLFWYLGIFNSMGLKRVLIAIIPLISIMALVGYNFLTAEIPMKSIFKTTIQITFLGLIAIFPFTSNPAAINFKRDLMLTNNQRTIQTLSQYVLEIKEKGNTIAHANPYMSETLSLDHFDIQQRLEFTQDYMNFTKQGDILIWASWFCVIEHGVLENSLNKNNELIRLKDFKNSGEKNEFRYIVYRRR